MVDFVRSKLGDVFRTRRSGAWGAHVRRRRTGFSLIDLMVTMAVMSVLLGLLAPSIRLVTEAARRVKCQKNLADIGLGLTMWTDDHHDTLPSSSVAGAVFSEEAADPIQQSSLMEIAHLDDDDPNDFDGLGKLLQFDYVPEPRAFYCPSHTGDYPYDLYATSWVALDQEIVINYHYRLFENQSDARLPRLDPRTTLVTDGMRSVSDYNHRTGNNMLRADMSVSWYADDENYIASILPESEDDPGAGVPVFASWIVFDTGTPPGGPTPGGSPTANSIMH